VRFGADSSAAMIHVPGGRLMFATDPPECAGRRSRCVHQPGDLACTGPEPGGMRELVLQPRHPLDHPRIAAESAGGPVRFDRDRRDPA